MAVPAEVQSALDQVQSDSEALESAKAAAAAAQAALDDAQAAATSSAQAVVDAAGKQAQDLAALQQLLNETYGPGAARMAAASTGKAAAARKA